MEKKCDADKFDYKLVLDLLKKMSDDKDKFNLQMFHDLCKALTKISSSMGSLVSWGFDGTRECGPGRHPREVQVPLRSHGPLP